MTKSSHGEGAQGMTNGGNNGVYKTQFTSPDPKAGAFPVPNTGDTQLSSATGSRSALLAWDLPASPSVGSSSFSQQSTVAHRAWQSHHRSVGLEDLPQPGQTGLSAEWISHLECIVTVSFAL